MMSSVVPDPSIKRNILHAFTSVYELRWRITSPQSMLVISVQIPVATALQSEGGYSLSGAVRYFPLESLPMKLPCGRWPERRCRCKSISSVTMWVWVKAHEISPVRAISVAFVAKPIASSKLGDAKC